MDKRKVITAYRRGLISVQECAQILGLENVKLIAMMRETAAAQKTASHKQSVRS